MKNKIFLGIAFAGIMAQIVMMTWLCSGTRTEYIFPMAVAGAISFVFASFWQGVPGRVPSPFEKTVFYCGGAVIIIAVIQYLNPWAEFINGERFYSLLSLKHVEFLPSTVAADYTRNNPQSMIAMMIAVYTTLLASLKVFKDSRLRRIALIFFAVNGTVMAAYAAVARETGIPPIMYNTLYSEAHYFGSFFLENAGALFVDMVLAVNLALLLSNIKAGFGLKEAAESLLWILFAGVCGYSCYLSQSNGAIMAAGLMLFFFAVICYYKILRGFMPGLRSVAVMLITVIAGTAIVIAINYTPKMAEKLKFDLSLSMSARWEMFEVAVNKIKERPIMGYGVNSAQYVMTVAMVKQEGPKGNFYVSIPRVHSDILEYLFEFGLSGYALIIFCFFMFYFDGVWRHKKLSPHNAMLAAALFACVLYAGFDMPLHILSTMLGCTFLAAFGASREKGDQNV